MPALRGVYLHHVGTLVDPHGAHGRVIDAAGLVGAELEPQAPVGVGHAHRSPLVGVVTADTGVDVQLGEHLHALEIHVEDPLVLGGVKVLDEAHLHHVAGIRLEVGQHVGEVLAYPLPLELVLLPGDVVCPAYLLLRERAGMGYSTVTVLLQLHDHLAGPQGFCPLGHHQERRNHQRGGGAGVEGYPNKHLLHVIYNDRTT